MGGSSQRGLLRQQGVPTIGYGYALAVDGRNGWTARDDADLQSVGITLAPGDRQRLDQVAQALENNRNAKSSVRRRATEQAAPIADYGTTLTDQAARDTFDLAAPTYKSYVTQAIGQSRFDRLFPEQQAALFDLAYRRPAWLRNNQTALQNALNADYAAATTANTAAALGNILPQNDARAQSAIDYFKNPKAEWVYQVQPGETFDTIKKKLGVAKWGDISLLNGHIADPNHIHGGQRIYFPAPQVTRRSGRMP